VGGISNGALLALINASTSDIKTALGVASAELGIASVTLSD